MRASRFSMMITNHVDWDNDKNGQYGLGDIQYHAHSAINSGSLMYWKETKSFSDGCSAHISGG